MTEPQPLYTRLLVMSNTTPWLFHQQDNNSDDGLVFAMASRWRRGREQAEGAESQTGSHALRILWCSLKRPLFEAEEIRLKCGPTLSYQSRVSVDLKKGFARTQASLSQLSIPPGRGGRSKVCLRLQSHEASRWRSVAFVSKLIIWSAVAWAVLSCCQNAPRPKGAALSPINW